MRLTLKSLIFEVIFGVVSLFLFVGSVGAIYESQTALPDVVEGEILVIYKADQSPAELQKISDNYLILSPEQQLQYLRSIGEDIPETFGTPNVSEEVLGISTEKLIAKISPFARLSNPPTRIVNNASVAATLKNLADSKKRFVNTFYQDNQIAQSKVQELKALEFTNYVYKSESKNVEAEIQKIKELDEVDIVEPNRIFYTLDKTPNDPQFPKMWALPALNAPKAWDKSVGSNSVIVGVVDNGIDKSHPDLKDRVTEVVTSGGCGTSGDHGTHVAGSIGAAGNNSLGVVGLNWDVKIVGAKSLCGSSGSGSAIIQGINDVVAKGAKVINMSLGGRGSCGGYGRAIDAAVAKGVTVVVAAGNDNSDARNFAPANCSNVITISALGPNDEKAHYSNFGPNIWAGSPGGNPSGGSSTCKSDSSDCILSTWPSGIRCPSTGQTDGYCPIAGTSMASPNAAGVVALMYAVNPSMNNEKVKNILKETSKDLGTAGRDNYYGWGKIDAAAAIAKAAEGGGTQPTPSGVVATVTSAPPASITAAITSSINPTNTTAPRATNPPSSPTRAILPTLFLPPITVTAGVPNTTPIPTPMGAKSAVISQTYQDSCGEGSYRSLIVECSDGRKDTIASSSGCDKIEALMSSAIYFCAKLENSDVTPNPVKKATRYKVIWNNQ